MGASPSKPDENNSSKTKKRKSTKTTGPNKTSKKASATTKSTKDSKKSKGSSKSKDSKQAPSEPQKEQKKEDVKEEATNAPVNGLPQWKPERVKNVEWPPPKQMKEKEPIPVKPGSVLAAVRAAESTTGGSVAFAAAAAVTQLKEKKKADAAKAETPNKNGAGVETAKQVTTTKPKTSTGASTKLASSSTKLPSSSGVGKPKQPVETPTTKTKSKKGEATTTKTKKKKKKAGDTSSASSGSKTSKASKKTRKSTNKNAKLGKQRPSEITTIKESDKEHVSSTPRDAPSVTTEPVTVSSTPTMEVLFTDKNASPNVRISSWAKMLRGEANLLGKSVGDGNDHSESRGDAVSTLTRSDSLRDAEPKTKFGGAVRAARLAFRRELGREQDLDGGLEDTSHGVPSSILRERLSETGGTLLERIKLAVARELEEAAEEVEGNDSAKLQLDAELLRLLSFLVCL